MDEKAAARSVNFRLLRPTLEGIRYNANALQVRLEGPPYSKHPDPASTVWSHWAGLHNASVCLTLDTRFGQLRSKQYLYDIGPLSTLDHAALYDHRPECMRVHELDELRLAWTGFDYQKKRALTMLAWGTNIELREIAGEHPISYLIELARSLEPVIEREQQPMARRSYWSRYPRYDLNMCRLPGYCPPSSLWRWRWPWLSVDHRWQTEMPDMPVPGVRKLGREVCAPDWKFDSACVFGAPSAPGEVQVLFHPSSELGHACLWLRQFPRDNAPLSEPAFGEWPQIESHSGFSRFSLTNAVSSNLQRVYVASKTVRYGPHDALWWQERHGYLLQLSAGVKHSLHYLCGLLSSVLQDTVEVF